MENETWFTEQFEPLQLKKEFSGVRLPKIKIDDHYYDKLGISKDTSNFDFLKKLCADGFKDLVKKGKIDLRDKKLYADRVNFELKTLQQCNFIDYILLVWDTLNFCNENGILIGTGRGSAAGSCVCYFTGITAIDPIKYKLFFERFISPSRAKSEIIEGELYLTGVIPDIDCDIEYTRRHEVFEYLEKKYPGQTSKISNFSTLTGKNLIKECGKIISHYSEFDVKKVSDLVPVVFGTVRDISECYNGIKDKNGEFKEKPIEEFVGWCDQNPKIYNTALQLRDLIKNKSVHASGLAISADKITDLCPIEFNKEGGITSGYDKKSLEKFCVKMDLLGLKTLSLIDETCKLVGIENYKDIDVNDPCIYAYLKDFRNSYGIFQLETPAGEKVTKMMKPQDLNDLSALMALNRPGAISFISKYIENRNRGYGDSIHPLFDEALKDEYQLPIFQESIMALLGIIGFSLEDAYQVIKVIGKKLINEAKIWEGKIYEKAKENGFPEEVASLLWKTIQAASSYSFNKCLSINSVVEGENGFDVLKNIKIGDKIKARDTNLGLDVFVNVKNKYENKVELFKVEFEDGRTLCCSMDHMLLCSDLKKRRLEDILKNNLEVLCNGEILFKDILGYEGLYKIGSNGIIVSNVKNGYGRNSGRTYGGSVMKQKIQKNGYVSIQLCKNGVRKTRLVHAIVAQSFIPSLEGKQFVNHRNGIKTDNRADNLEWVTSSENMKHAYAMGLGNHEHCIGVKSCKAVLDESQVINIIKKNKAGNMSQRKLAEEYGVSIGCISGIIYNQNWKHLDRNEIS
jgi:Bacterial DNA polymerase III alpha NTPase domain/Bacterial DNA polymerase III alpha subunit finger domain/HNH endonuclease/NUMOD4 motif